MHAKLPASDPHFEIPPDDPAVLEDDPASAPDDDLPDFSTPYWVAQFAKAKVTRGRPRELVTKVSTTIRLDPDVLAAFKAQGPGWQSRMNEALRRAAGL